MSDKDIYQRGTENSLEGKLDDVKGKVKDAAGGLTGDTSLQSEGKFDQAKGKLKDKLGEVQRDIGETNRRDDI